VNLFANQDDIILLKITDHKPVINYLIEASFKKSSETLKTLAQEKGIVQERLDDQGQSSNIYVYSYRTKDGLVMYYKNKSSDLTLEEEINYKLEGCTIIGHVGSNLEIKIGGGEEKIIQIAKDDDAAYFRINID
jgi:hypothetical protein